MLKKVLESNIPQFLTLYENAAIKTLADNIDEMEIDNLIAELDRNGELAKRAFTDVNPALVDGFSSKEKKLQKLHVIFRQYFTSSDKYFMVLDKVAFNLSYGNNVIRKMVDSIYRDPAITYDETIRKMQRALRSALPPMSL